MCIRKLPRFELEWERKLNDDLKALGMIDAFDGFAADFTPMYAAARDVGLHVANVKQKTFLKVDEEGTEAAAVTVVEMGVTSCCAGPREIRADRPFFLAIRERLGEVLSIGPDHVSVKGKTNEGMGWIGAGEGLAVHAVALVDTIREPPGLTGGGGGALPL